MFKGFEFWVAGRYLKSRRQDGFISLIAWFSLIGIALGVATLIIVLSVMNGFRHELLTRVLGINGHLTIQAQIGESGIKEFEKEIKVVERLKQISARHDKSIAQMAIAWTLGHPAVSVGLVGVRNEWELKENVAAVEWVLDEATREEIDSIFIEENVPTHVNTDQAI